MVDKGRRKALREQYDQARREAGVYRISNSGSGKSLLGSTVNLANIRSKLDFARRTNSAGVLDHRLKQDVAAFGIGALSLEILDVLETTPEMTREEILADLEALEQLWREKLDPASLY